ncbi:MAG: Crp/Fnr family transcriptional regulator [Hyphomicrobiaceae bacterium]
MRLLESFRAFEPDELSFVEGFKVGELSVQAGSSIFLEGHNSPHLYTVLDGWTMRYKTLENGKRQVLNFPLRGDLLGLQNVLFDTMLHSVEALTEVRLCVFQREGIWKLFEKHAGLAYDLTWMAAREESILAETLAAVGQMPARERLAFAIIHLFDRARRAGMTKGKTMLTPLTQEHLADAMGLSLVHANKTLQKLKATGWVAWKGQEITLLDERKLLELSGYERPSNNRRPFI